MVWKSLVKGSVILFTLLITELTMHTSFIPSLRCLTGGTSACGLTFGKWCLLVFSLQNVP